MPILGSHASQSGRTPGVPTSVSATAGDGQAVVSFTEPTYKGKGTVSYTVTSSPGGITATGSSSPITVTGLTNGTTYTFTVAASTSGIASAASSASAGVAPTPPNYVLSQTFTSGGTYTVPSGKSYLAVVVASGGSAGATGGAGNNVNAANSGAGLGGAGGAAGCIAGLTEYAVTPGQTFSVTVGAAAGTSIFGSILQATANSPTSNIGTAVLVNTAANAGTGATRQIYRGSNGTFLGTAADATKGNIASVNFGGTGGLNTINVGAGGGGGGAGYHMIGSSGGNPAGSNGNGGSGGSGSGSQDVPGYAGSAATGYSSGGGGGGGGSAYNNASNGGAGGAGTQGIVYVYVR